MDYWECMEMPILGMVSESGKSTFEIENKLDIYH